MPARIKLDAYNYQQYGTVDGTVCFLSPDSGVSEGGKSSGSTPSGLKCRGTRWDGERFAAG